ncbi:uncharacterized protein J3R85_015222 [Psidium guajava]|nr:uncharacterized protein J3R85_015222 [Psidium guajava]
MPLTAPLACVPAPRMNFAGVMPIYSSVRIRNQSKSKIVHSSSLLSFSAIGN